MSLIKHIGELKEKALGELAGASNAKELEAWRIRYLGKKSRLNDVLRGLPNLPLDEKKEVGAAANRLKMELEKSLSQKEQKRLL